MTREKLNSARAVHEKIIALEWRLARLRSTAERITPILDGMPHSHSPTSRVEILAIEINETGRELDELRDELSRACETVAGEIFAADLTDKEESVLLMRYVACATFHDIEVELGLSEANVFYHHRNACKKIFAINSRLTVD